MVRERTYQKRHPLFQVTIIFVHGLNESITSPITRPTTRGSTDLDMVGALEGQVIIFSEISALASCK
uniref:Uncharacterized protein n=1 Tax=Oryza nivara TaxID=4536 RepID=A0A0E0J6S6_ORYNI